MCLISNHFKRIGNGNRLWMPKHEVWDLPDLIFGALFSLSKDTYFNIGGYDERFYGWGHEDGYLGAKAIAANKYIIPVYAASALHIKHPPRSGKNKQQEYTRNRKQYLRLLRTTKTGNYKNYLRLAKNRIIESFTPHFSFQSYIKNDKAYVEQNNEFAINYIQSLLAIGQYSRAFTILTENKKKYKKRDYFFTLGKVFFGMNQYEKALNAFTQASIFTNFNFQSLLNLAITQAANDQFIAAHTTLEKIYKKYPELSDFSYWYQYPVEKHIRQGKNYFDQGFYQIAIRCFEVALIKEPNNKIAFTNRNRCIDLM